MTAFSVKAAWRAGVLCSVAWAGSAAADTITFSGLPTGLLTAGATYTEGAYTITVGPADPGDTTRVENVGGANGNVLVDGNPSDRFGSLTEISLTSGGLFDVTSLQVANLDDSGPVSVNPGSGYRIEVSGAPGGDDVYGPGSSTFTTVSPTDLAGLTQLQINIVSNSPSQEDFAVDNVAVSAVAPVPEPPSAAVLGAGLVGAFLVVRQRRSRAG